MLGLIARVNTPEMKILDREWDWGVASLHGIEKSA